MSSSKKQTVGYKYYVGLHNIWCHGPIDAIRRIFVGEKVAWTGNVTENSTITVSNEDLFGGEASEGGVSGSIDVLMGRETQPRNSYLLAQLGSTASAFRGIVSLVWKQFYFGTSYYLKEIWLEATRTQTGWDGAEIWYPAKATIAFDAATGKPAMNIIHFIRECLISTEWGMGVPEGDIDDVAFKAAADVCYSEKFGVSLMWQVAGAIEDKLNELKDTCDCVIFVHPQTGLHTIRLIRDDYVVDDLPVLDTGSIIAVQDYARTEFSDLVNSVALTYWDQVLESDNVLRTDDPAMVAVLGKIVEEPREYSAVVDEELAGRLALRDLRALSSPMLSCTLTCTRVAADFLPGMPFRFVWPQLHDGEIVMRVATVGFGDTEKEEVTITCVEDIFALPDNAAAGGENIDWVDPSTAEIGVARAFIVEAPYWELVQRYGDATINALLAANPVLGRALLASSAAAYAFNADGYIEDVQLAATIDLSPTGILTGALNRSATLAAITWDRTPGIGSHIQIGAEIVRFDGYSGLNSIIGRGCLDTVPVAHVIGEDVWAWDAFAAADEIDRVDGETVDGYVRPKNPSKLGSNSATVSTTMDARAIRPYPMGNVYLNGERDRTTVSGNLTVQWAHRDRKLQATLIDTTAGSVGPEVGTTYTVKVIAVSSGVELYSNTAITVDAANLNAAAILPGGATTDVRLELWAVRDGYASWQKHNFTFSWSV